MFLAIAYGNTFVNGIQHQVCIYMYKIPLAQIMTALCTTCYTMFITYDKELLFLPLTVHNQYKHRNPLTAKCVMAACTSRTRGLFLTLHDTLFRK